MANIFQQTLTDIPVQGYKPTEQKNTAVADTITAVGNTLLEADAARERVSLEGLPSDEVPMMDKWTPEEMAGPYRPGEPPIFRAKHEEVFDASADLNLSQIVKARKQGLITPGEAEVRINSALRQAINRRPGRQAELVQTANEYLGVYSGITKETEAEKAAKEAADMNQKLEYHFRTKFGLGREAGEKWQLQLTMDEMRARSEQGIAATQPAEFARLDQQVAYQMLSNVMNLPEQDRPEAVLAIKTFLDGAAVKRHGMIGSTYLDKGLRESAIAEYDKHMARVYERAGDVDFMNLSAKRNNELSQAGLGHIYAALGPEMAVLAEKFPERAVDQITRIMISYDKIAKDKKFEKNPEMLDEVLWNEAIKNGHFGIMAYKLRGMPESVWGRAMLQGKEEVQKGIRNGHRPPSLSTLEYGTGAADQMVYDQEMGEDPYPAGLAFLNNAVDDPMSYVYALNPEKKAILDGHPRLKEKLIRSLTVSYQALVSQLGHNPTEPNLVQKIFDISGSMAAHNIEIEKLKAVVKTAKGFGVDLEALSGAPDNNSVSKKNSEGNAMNPIAVDFIKEAEGYRDTAYQDSAGIWTIGYGTTKGVKEGDTITQEEATKRLAEDMTWASDAVKKHVKVPLTPEQEAAIISLVYNVGEGAFARSRSLKKLNAGDYEGFAEGVFGEHGYVNAGGKRVQGLVNRRNKERALFEGVV